MYFLILNIQLKFGTTCTMCLQKVGPALGLSNQPLQKLRQLESFQE